MPGFRHGATRGILLIGTAFLATILVTYGLPLVGAADRVPDWAGPALGAAVILSLALTLKASKYWSYAYLGGFIGGVGLALFVALRTPVLGLRSLLLYGGAAVAAVVLRVKIHR
jgi:hypothetical protein